LKPKIEPLKAENELEQPKPVETATLQVNQSTETSETLSASTQDATANEESVIDVDLKKRKRVEEVEIVERKCIRSHLVEIKSSCSTVDVKEPVKAQPRKEDVKPVSLVAAPVSNGANRKPGVCFSYIRDRTCRFGANCVFSHSEPLIKRVKPIPPVDPSNAVTLQAAQHISTPGSIH